MSVALLNQKASVGRTTLALHLAGEWARHGQRGCLRLRHPAEAIDITPAMRGGIKVVAFRRGVTVADMLRALLTREFPEDPGEQGHG